MLKVVIFDSGYGGELFADQLEKELPVLEVIRVIDWRNAEKIQSDPKEARQCAKTALAPYLGKVDLIIFANYLLSLTSLKYFKRQYKNQPFLGLSLKAPDSFIRRDVLILATKPIIKTISYRSFIFHINRKIKTLALDTWPAKIDDGELAHVEICDTIQPYLKLKDFDPKEVILACAQFNDIKKELKDIFGKNLKIYDGFNEAIIKTSKLLKLRGGTGKKSRA